jgi:hypothetical protein
MRCLYQKDERAQPGNLQNRMYSFFLSYSPNLVSLTTSPFLSSLSLSLSLSLQRRRLVLPRTSRLFILRVTGLDLVYRLILLREYNVSESVSVSILRLKDGETSDHLHTSESAELSLSP